MITDTIEAIRRFKKREEPTVVFKTTVLDTTVNIRIYEHFSKHFVGYQHNNNIDLYIPVEFFNCGKSLLELYLHELIHFVQWYKNPIRHTFKTQRYLFDTELEAYIYSIAFSKRTPKGYHQAIKDLYENLDIDREDVETPDVDRKYYQAVRMSVPNQKPYFYIHLDSFLKDLNYLKKIDKVTIKILMRFLKGIYSE